MANVTFYINRENVATLTLQIKREGETVFSTVDAGVVTRAMLSFGIFCLDTDDADHADIFYLNADATAVKVKGGHITALAPGVWLEAKLTVFDSLNPEGLAWDDLQVTAVNWPVC